MAVAVAFRAKAEGLGPRLSIGGLLIHPSLTFAEINEFALKLTEAVGPVEFAPLNGHLSLGVSQPEPHTDPSKITFLCAAPNARIDALFAAGGPFRYSRSLFALSTKVTAELKNRVRHSEDQLRSRGFSSRPLSLIRYKRDIEIYNRLVNQAMVGHPAFYPLSFDEEWDIMGEAILVFKPSWFRFLTYKGREIGFSFAVPDYNPYLSNRHGDEVNSALLAWQRLAGRRRRARLVYSGIEPEFKGQGLFKAVRHRVINEMIKSGVEEFESSYIDQDNKSSLANVRSTGGRVSHTFNLFTSVQR